MLCSRPRQLRLCRMRCGASFFRRERERSSAPHGAEHPSPTAAAERAALRSARCSTRAHGSSGSAGCGAERLSSVVKEKEAPPRMEQSIHPPWRQQSVPHSGVTAPPNGKTRQYKTGGGVSRVVLAVDGPGFRHLRRKNSIWISHCWLTVAALAKPESFISLHEVPISEIQRALRDRRRLHPRREFSAHRPRPARCFKKSGVG